MKAPTVTPVQIIAAIGSIIGLLIANGVVTNDTGKLVTGLAAIVVPLAFVIGDAIIRHGHATAHNAATASTPTSTTG